MPLRFFADHCVSNAIIQALRTTGAEALQLRDYLPTAAPDAEVIAMAQQLDAVLVSLNGDFADIVTYPPANYRGIVALQVRNHPEVIPQLMARFTAYVSSHPTMQDYQGKLFVVEVHRIRIRQ